MVDANKIYKMTRVTSYEKKGKAEQKMFQYSKGRYIALKQITTLLLFTVAYVLSVMLYQMKNLDEILTQGYLYPYGKVLQFSAIGYLLVLIGGFIYTRIYYTRKYNEMLVHIRQYDQDLSDLYQYIKSRENEKSLC